MWIDLASHRLFSSLVLSTFHALLLLFYLGVCVPYQGIKSLVWLKMLSSSAHQRWLYVNVCTYVWRWYNCFPRIHLPILRSSYPAPSFRFQFRHGWMLPREHFAQIIIAVFLASQVFVASASVFAHSTLWNGFFRFWFFPFILFIRSSHINLLYFSVNVRCTLDAFEYVWHGMAWHGLERNINRIIITYFLFHCNIFIHAFKLCLSISFFPQAGSFFPAYNHACHRTKHTTGIAVNGAHDF